MTNSYMEIVEAADTNPNTIKEPAKRWRNWWRVLESFTGEETGDLHLAGDIMPGLKFWPSKDVAEQRALENMKDDRYPLAEYLGAFPEGERP